MSTFRTVKDPENPFVMMDKRPVNDETISWGAKGLLAYLLSKPNDWTIILTDLVKRSTDGRYAVRNLVNELVEAGYIVKSSKRDEGGRFQTSYDVFETPVHRVRFPDAGNPTRETGVGKPHTTNNDLQIMTTNTSETDLLDGMIHFANTKQAQDAQAVEELFQLLEKELKLNYNRTASNESIVKKIYKEHKSGRTIQRWITWAKEDKWKLEHGYYANLKNVWSTYPLAFKSSKASKMLDIS